MIIEFVQAHSRLSIILFSLIVTIFITIVNFFAMDRVRMRELKQRQKHLQQQMKEHKDNPQKLTEINKEMMAQIGESFRHSLKPMIITLLPVLIFFYWLRQLFADTIISKTWFWYYIGFSVVFSIVLRKVFKLD